MPRLAAITTVNNARLEGLVSISPLRPASPSLLLLLLLLFLIFVGVVQNKTARRNTYIYNCLWQLYSVCT